jgi:tyrosyl-DNA phosphodiesterase-1
VMALANAASSSSRRPSKTARKKNEHDSDIEDLDSDLEEIQEVEPPQPYGWAYIGSHNFTPSAWGTLSGSSFNPTLNVCASRVHRAPFPHYTFRL